MTSSDKQLARLARDWVRKHDAYVLYATGCVVDSRLATEKYDVAQAAKLALLGAARVSAALHAEEPA